MLNLTLQNAIEKLKSKEISSLELTEAYLKSISTNIELNIYITITDELARKRAIESDKRRMQNALLSEIDGIPLAIKDIFLTKGILTTNASNFLSKFIAPYESTITQKLLDAGYVCLGKVNLDEFAMGSTTSTSYFGMTINPWSTSLDAPITPGGSSGGSAAAIAARSALGALGTDTGGSIRQPASFCGLVGMKPSYGRCSRYGIISFSSSLDQAGPMTRNVVDNALLLKYMTGYDANDATSLKLPEIDYTRKIGDTISKHRIGIPKEYLELETLHPEIKEKWQKSIKLLEQEGAEIVEISLPHVMRALEVYYVINPCEAFSNYARFDGIRYGKQSNQANLLDIVTSSRGEGWGDEVKRRLLLGSHLLLSEHYQDYLQAAKVRALIQQEFMSAFKTVDIILTPTTEKSAFSLNEVSIDPIDLYMSDLFTVSANLTGLPAISVPCGLSNNNLPLGMEFIGKYFQEDEIYKYAYILEQKIQFKDVANFAKTI